jgi:hypothetical protein
VIFYSGFAPSEGQKNDKTNSNNRGLNGLTNSAYFFDGIKHCWLTREQKTSMRDYLRSGLINPQ